MAVGNHGLDYRLKIDEQVSKFLELHHAVTFFVITAAVASLAFTLNFASSQKVPLASDTWNFGLLCAAALAALSSAGLSMRALNKDIASFRLHLKFSYERREFDDLSASEQRTWDRINKAAARSRKWSFMLLIVSVAMQSAFLIVLLRGGPPPMHHYGESSTQISSTDTTHVISFRNKVTGKEVMMSIPRVGSGEDPQTEVSLGQVARIADEVAHILRSNLE